MADNPVDVRWTGEGLQFRGGAAGGGEVTFDGDGVAGPSPVSTLLLSLASCSGADVVEIAGKMRVALTRLEIHSDGDRAAHPPRRFERIRLTYRIGGVAADDHAKIRRAVDLSHEKYCSVVHTLRPDCEVISHIEFVDG